MTEDQARRLVTMDRPVPSFKLLCVMAHHVCDTLPAGAMPSDIDDALKWEIARAHLEYPPPHWLAAVREAVVTARAKGYATPRRP
jgi:hypothetical protein